MTVHEPETMVRVAGRRMAASGVLELELVASDGSDLPSWEPGAHIDLQLTDGLVRQYSLCGDPSDRSMWRIGVLLETNGRGGSAFVHKELLEGALVLTRGPRNHFSLEIAPAYLFIAGGIGITPMLPMIREASRAGAVWQLVYGGRQRTSMAFLEELSSYGDNVAIEPFDEMGHIDLARWLSDSPPDALIYCCGPEPLLEAVEAATVQRRGGSLRTERFAARTLAAPERHEAFEVELRQSGRTITVPPGMSILEVVEAEGIAVSASCCEGVCGSCETAVLGGIPDHRDSVLTDEERAANDRMLICVSRSKGNRLILDL